MALILVAQYIGAGDKSDGFPNFFIHVEAQR